MRPDWLAQALLSLAAVAIAVGYFVVFWQTAGQTPGMRLMGVRVALETGQRPVDRVAGAVADVGLALAIIPCFLGFVPALFDRRRRALPDYLAGTVVVYDDAASVTRRDRSAETRRSDGVAGKARARQPGKPHRAPPVEVPALAAVRPARRERDRHGDGGRRGARRRDDARVRPQGVRLGLARHVVGAADRHDRRLRRPDAQSADRQDPHLGRDALGRGLPRDHHRRDHLGVRGPGPAGAGSGSGGGGRRRTTHGRRPLRPHRRPAPAATRAAREDAADLLELSA